MNGGIDMIEKLIKDGDGFKDPLGGCYYESESDFLFAKILNFCTCGNQLETMIYIKEMLQKLVTQQWSDYSDMPYIFFVRWADSMKFTDHGISVRCSFLTDYGNELLRDLNICILKELTDK